MRVLLVSNLFRPVTLGGYERGCAEFADHLRACGHEVAVLTTDLTDDPPGVQDPSGIPVARVLRSYRRLDGTFRNGGLRWRITMDRHNSTALTGLSRRFRPDAVMLWNLGGLNLSLMPAAASLGVPTCGVVNDFWMEWAHRHDQWQHAKRRIPLLGPVGEHLIGLPGPVEPAAIDHWIFVSDFVRRRALEHVGPLRATSIVHSGIDLARFTPRPPRPEWGGRLLVVGRVTKNKGVDRAVDALAALPPETTLTICGARDSSLGDELEAQIARLGLTDRVRFVERSGAEAVAAEYAAHDALLFPGRWEEPWGKVPLEAMACGIPVVMSATGGSAEYAAAGENALLAAEPAELAAAVTRLGTDPGLRERLTRGGIETAGRYGTGQANAGRLAVIADLVTSG